MFRLDEGLKVYLHRAPIDFRLSINGLALLVEQALGLSPFASCVYVVGPAKFVLPEQATEAAPGDACRYGAN